MLYEPNDKHKKPWQRGKQGSLCPRSIDSERAQTMLDASVADGRKRYASDGARAYCAQQHVVDHWHGYPVGWEEVPPKIRAQLVERHGVSPRDLRRYWRGEVRR